MGWITHKNPELMKHLREHIRPMYAELGVSHGFRHVDTVVMCAEFYFNELRRMLCDAQDLNMDINVLMVAAYYHDVGLSDGRDGHEHRGAEILRSHTEILEGYLNDTWKVMQAADAVEDHRASSDVQCRSLYGRLLRCADITPGAKAILRRWLESGREKLGRIYTLEEVYEKVHSKHGPDGYTWKNLQLQLPNVLKIRDECKKVFGSIEECGKMYDIVLAERGN